MTPSDELLQTIAAEVVRDAAQTLAQKLAKAGYVLAPLSPTENMLLAALLLGVTEPSREDRDVAARACKSLSRPQEELDKKGIVDAAAYLAQNYRAMISAIRPNA